MGFFEKAREKARDLFDGPNNEIDAVTGATSPIDGGDLNSTTEDLTVAPPLEANQGTDERSIETRVDSLKTEAGLAYEYNLTSNSCFRVAVNKKYKELANQDDKRSVGEFLVDIRKGFDVNKKYPVAGKVVYKISRLRNRWIYTKSKTSFWRQFTVFTTNNFSLQYKVNVQTWKCQ